MTERKKKKKKKNEPNLYLGRFLRKARVKNLLGGLEVELKDDLFTNALLLLRV